jgi:hypothetical protein
MPRMTGDLGAAVQQLWDDVLAIVGQIVSPDWSALVLLIPLVLAPLVLLHLAMSTGLWTFRWATKPRPKVRWEEGARPLELDAGGTPVPPAGLPFSLRAGLVYPPGTVRTDAGEDLAVICPMCRVERAAQLPTCGNCGLVLTVKQGMAVARPAGPPPGGAAVA